MTVYFAIRIYRRSYTNREGELAIDRTWLYATSLPFLPTSDMKIDLGPTVPLQRLSHLDSGELAALKDWDSLSILVLVGEGYFDVPSQIYVAEAKWWTHIPLEKAVLLLDAMVKVSRPNPFLVRPNSPWL